MCYIWDGNCIWKYFSGMFLLLEITLKIILNLIGLVYVLESFIQAWVYLNAFKMHVFENKAENLTASIKV